MVFDVQLDRGTLGLSVSSNIFFSQTNLPTGTRSTDDLWTDERETCQKLEKAS